MARITVEDCLDNVDNRFELVMLAAKRARQIATQGKDLKALLEAGSTDQQLMEEIGATWSARKDQYSVLRGKSGEDGWHRTSQKVEMSYIGG